MNRVVCLIDGFNLYHVLIERGHLLSSRLPNSMQLGNGETVTCPPEYLL